MRLGVEQSFQSDKRLRSEAYYESVTEGFRSVLRLRLLVAASFGKRQQSGAFADLLGRGSEVRRGRYVDHFRPLDCSKPRPNQHLILRKICRGILHGKVESH